MKQVQVVVSLSKEMFEKIRQFDGKHDVLINREDLYEAIKNSTPLPKNHGDLKDTDEIIEKIRRLPNGGRQWFVNAESVFNIILDAPTIIQAESEEE